MYKTSVVNTLKYRKNVEGQSFNKIYSKVEKLKMKHKTKTNENNSLMGTEHSI